MRATTSTISRRETRKQDRRQAIIEAARRSFFDDGYAAMSMSGLLTMLGGSKATLWSYFRSKEELFAAVIEDTTSAFQAKLESEMLEGQDLKEIMIAFCRGFMSKMYDPEAIGLWRLILAESGRFPELGRIFYEKAALRVEQDLASYLQKQIDDGHLGGESAERMAQFLMSLCNTRHNSSLWGITSPDVAQLKRDAERFAEYFLKLFRNPNGISASS